MKLLRLFPTRVLAARPRLPAGLTARLLRACQQIQADDNAGQRWSRRNYPGGYTSYGSLNRLHRLDESFERLQAAIDPWVARFANELQFDLTRGALAMTDCWINIMPAHVVHSLHLHPHASISGTFYLQTPRGCAGLKLEDPRLDRYMAAPPRRTKARTENQSWITLPARAGHVVLFESWLRHEVPPNTSSGERISVSFNYNWF